MIRAEHVSVTIERCHVLTCQPALLISRLTTMAQRYFAPQRSAEDHGILTPVTRALPQLPLPGRPNAHFLIFNLFG